MPGRERKAAVYLDCWAGNGEKLVGYVSKMYNVWLPVRLILEGFTNRKVLYQWIASRRRRDDGSLWVGKLLRMDIDESDKNKT